MSDDDERSLLTARRLFISNMHRVQELVEASRAMPRDVSASSELSSDMIRAAVVFSHATLEDLLRSLLEIQLPYSDAKSLQAIPMVGQDERAKAGYDLGHLAGHRDRTVDDLIRKSIVAHLSRSTYNNIGEVVRTLDRLGISREVLGGHGSNLAAMMNRRHHIAHRADRNDGEDGLGIYRIIEFSSVSAWARSVYEFGSSLLEGFTTGFSDLETE